jgi:tRNA threonylcarbamoyl adenosine modification protein YeaZ
MKTIDNMLYLLLLASSDASIKVALFRGFVPLAELIKTECRMSAHLTQAFEDVLKMGGVALTDLDFIAVSQGPGLFSHLRAALAICNGIAMVHSIPLVGIDYLKAWCDIMALKYEKAEKNSLLATIYNAYNNEFHYRIEIARGDGRTVLAGPAYTDKHSLEKLLECFRSSASLCLLAGDACRLLSNQVNLSPLEICELSPEKELLCMAHWALAQWNDQKTPVYELQPLYLKDTQFKKSE